MLKSLYTTKFTLITKQERIPNKSTGAPSARIRI